MAHHDDMTPTDYTDTETDNYTNEVGYPNDADRNAARANVFYTRMTRPGQGATAIDATTDLLWDQTGAQLVWWERAEDGSWRAGVVGGYETVGDALTDYRTFSGMPY